MVSGMVTLLLKQHLVSATQLCLEDHDVSTGGSCRYSEVAEQRIALPSQPASVPQAAH